MRGDTARDVRRGRRVGRAAVTLLLLAVAGFLALALVARTHRVAALDVTITRAIQDIHLPAYGWALTHVSDLGYNPLSVLTGAAVAIPLALRSLRLEAVLAVASSSLASLVGAMLKRLIARARPSPALVHVVGHPHGYGFPSGHVTYYTTLFGFALYVVVVAWRRSLLRDLALAVLALLVLLVGPSRVYLGAHWPSDVLGASLFAGLWLAGTITLHHVLKPRLATWGPGSARRTRVGSPARQPAGTVAPR